MMTRALEQMKEMATMLTAKTIFLPDDAHCHHQHKEGIEQREEAIADHPASMRGDPVLGCLRRLRSGTMCRQ